MIDKTVIDKLVSEADLDERIDINLTKDGLTYSQIIDDTKNLIGNLKLSIAHQMLQIEIYEYLIKRCLVRSMKEAAGKKD